VKQKKSTVKKKGGEKRMDLKIGMKVRFGRANGQKTVGEVIKVNQKSVKVKTHEARGINGRSASGEVWRVAKHPSILEIVE
tara:strand:- start:6661 stop:6903 length:243 start_codon:yes stop_codon:yes gene_type:complete